MKTLAAVSLFVLAAWVSYPGAQDDMKLCQVEHSFDTCFRALNR
jgi:hypothetical protein